MPLTLCRYASHRFRQKPPSCTSLINVTFKSISVLRPWLVYMSSYAIILSRLKILCSKNCFPIFLLDFLPTSLIILHMKAPMTNQSDRSTPQALHSTLTIQLTFLKYFYIFFIFYATPRFLPQMTGTKLTKGPPAENDRRPRKRARRPYSSRNPPDAANSSNCSRLSWTVQAGNSRSHWRRLKLVSKL